VRGERHDEGEGYGSNVSMMLSGYGVSAEVCLFESGLGGTPELYSEVVDNYTNHDRTADTVRLYILDIF
jgi:hypothetical protein